MVQLIFNPNPMLFSVFWKINYFARQFNLAEQWTKKMEANYYGAFTLLSAGYYGNCYRTTTDRHPGIFDQFTGEIYCNLKPFII